MFILSLFNDVLFLVLEGATLLFLFLYILAKLDFIRNEWKKVLLFIAAYTIFGNIANLYWQIPHTLVYIVFCILLLSYLTKTNIYLSVVTNVILFIIYGVTEILSTIPVLFLTGTSFAEAYSDSLLQIKLLLLIRPIQIALIFLLTKFHFNRSFLQKQFFRNDNSSAAYLMIVLLFMSLFYSNIATYIQDITFLATSGLLFLSVLLLGLIDTKERLKLQNIENKLKLQQEYSKSMELVVDAVRKEKHDYQNHLSTLVALCTMNEPEAVSRVRSYALKLTTNSGSTGFRFYNTGNKYLDGLLAVKNNIARDKGIFFEVETEMTLENIDVDDVDLTTIVGNIIDNAFDAISMNSEEDKKIVSLTIYEQDGKCCISISNNGPQISDIHKKHIFDYKYSTKSKAEGERGYGLFIVKELINRNNGEISFDSSEVETEFRILFRCGSKSAADDVEQANTLQRMNF
jgi:signal transduction histidine kinase